MQPKSDQEKASSSPPRSSNICAKPKIYIENKKEKKKFVFCVVITEEKKKEKYEAVWGYKRDSEAEMEHQQQHQDMASGSPAEIKNDPGWVAPSDRRHWQFSNKLFDRRHCLIKWRLINILSRTVCVCALSVHYECQLKAKLK